jgi:hypothetical protein
MRAVWVLAMMIAVLAGPVYGQSKTPGPPPAPAKSQQEIEAEKAAEKAYRKSLSNIPDKPPADPWGIARGADQPEKVTKTPGPAKTPAAKKPPVTPN